MAQTTDIAGVTDGQVEISTDGSTWTDISGSTNKVEPVEQNRQTGDEYTLDGNYALVTSGKTEPVDVKVQIVFTQTAGEAYAVAHAAWLNRDPIYVRWAPRGNATGNKQYTTTKGVFKSFTWPTPMASEAKPQMVGFTMRTPQITEAAIS
ncbi:MAG: hypothetical protein GFH27_549283n419 [Chloroflexi bacterium AL-W]|nr:hypothetical protein [Chloroflexi bacterium AL-N1]NOK64460.1 hypothetical protein [Chloroflexi bacterium AL-N10]NOK75702.1 hypothetical protein [Chloroflexi bacterium AL-N5]NOK80540.1 hypothetical protein [Chloroflexi bacterium AL-W]NOK87054.1 hypothetical protein [Chloroflexi bacterium AL-N15]